MEETKVIPEDENTATVPAEESAAEINEVIADEVAPESSEEQAQETAAEVDDAPIEAADAEIEDVPAEESVTAKKEKKPVNKKRIGLIAGIGAAVALAVFAILFFVVIQPNSIYNDAVEALERSDFQTCQSLIDRIPNHKKVPELKKDLTYAMAESYIAGGELDIAESLLVAMPGDEKAQKLKQDIQYLRAVSLVEQEKYDDAKLLLDKIPDHEDPEQLHEQIEYAEAFIVLETGDYKTAYELFSKLGNFKDASTQKDIVYYEALAFKSLFNVQETLKNPASLRVTKVTFYKDSTSEGELDAVYEITATNSYGGSLGAYAYDLSLYDEEDNSGMISHSNYVDPDDYVDMLGQMLVDTIKTQTVFETTVDVARMNRLIIANVSFNIDLPFKTAGEVES